MNAGVLNRRIVIERQTTGRDDYGGVTQGTWETLATVWARRSDASDAETFAAGEKSATRKTRWLVRSSTVSLTFNAKDRLVYKSANYEIIGIKEATRDGRAFLEITTVVRND